MLFRSEDVLRKNERLTTLGLLAAEIAHEIRNPLTVLKLLHGGRPLGVPPRDEPRQTGRVFMMREWLELDSDEICKQLSITSTNLWVLLHRARLRLRHS